MKQRPECTIKGTDLDGVELELKHVRVESVEPVPSVQARLWAETAGLRVRFEVKGETGFTVQERDFQGPVCRDSCVEVFLQPPGQSAYLNVECNARGDLHTSWIRNPARRPEGGFAEYRLLNATEASAIQVIPGDLTPGPGAKDWGLEVWIPWALFTPLCGLRSPLGDWGMNLYKCADGSTHPHWLSWSPCREKNFHAPADFGRLRLQAA